MLESSSDLWRDTSSSTNQELLELIVADGVDILVDLQVIQVETGCLCLPEERLQYR